MIDPANGYLACGDIGPGKMPEPEVLLNYILKEVALPKDMQGLNVLVTAGPTQEAIDPVRYITNHSTGKMGYALARCCMLRGANVTLVTGKNRSGTTTVCKCCSGGFRRGEWFDAVVSRSAQQNIIIKAAAVADYHPAVTADEKIKKSDGNMSISLVRTQDILAYLGEHKRKGQFLCGFAMETQNLLGERH